MMCSVGCRVQAVRPASASDAPISFEEIAAALAGVFILAPAHRLPRELALHQVAELRRGGQVFQAAPVLAPAGPVEPGARGGEIQLLRFVRSSVARGAACERASVLDLVFLHQPAADFFLIAGRAGSPWW